MSLMVAYSSGKLVKKWAKMLAHTLCKLLSIEHKFSMTLDTTGNDYMK